MAVYPQIYNASFYVLADPPNDGANLTGFDLSLRSNLTEDVWHTTKIPVQNLSAFEYLQFGATLENTVNAPDSNNSFALTMNGSEIAGNTFYFDLISLFPETYKNRANGLRRDLGQNIKDLNPRFLRFPGGNNLEGYSIQSRWMCVFRCLWGLKG